MPTILDGATVYAGGPGDGTDRRSHVFSLRADLPGRSFEHVLGDRVRGGAPDAAGATAGFLARNGIAGKASSRCLLAFTQGPCHGFPPQMS